MTTFSVGGGGGYGGAGWHWGLPPPPIPPVIINSHLRDRPGNLIPVPEEDAEIRWGKPSQFQWSVTNPDRVIDRTRTIYIPREDDEEEDPLQELREYTETERTTETVRVSNPDDAEQYVDVKRILTITFQGPNGGAKGDIEIFHKFTLTQWTNP